MKRLGLWSGGRIGKKCRLGGREDGRVGWEGKRHVGDKRAGEGFGGGVGLGSWGQENRMIEGVILCLHITPCSLTTVLASQSSPFCPRCYQSVTCNRWLPADAGRHCRCCPHHRLHPAGLHCELVLSNSFHTGEPTSIMMVSCNECRLDQVSSTAKSIVSQWTLFKDEA